MKGSPLLRALLVVIALLAVLWPLRRLTSHATERVVAEPQATAESATDIHLAITATTAPFTFAVSHLGRIIWKGESAENSATRDVKLIFPPEGIDLQVDAKWNGGKQAAVRVDVTPKEGETSSKTLWGDAQVSDVLTFTKP